MKTFHKFLLIPPFLMVAMASRAQTTAPDLVKQGVALNDAGKYADAIAKYADAIKAAPNYASAYYEMGYTLIASGNGKDAMPILEKALAINPKAGGVYDMIGSYYDDDKQYDKAIEYYKKGIEADPGYQRLHYNLAISYYRQGKFAESEACAIDAIKLDPKHASSIRIYALATYRQQKRDCSLMAWCNFLILEPQTQRSPEGYNYIKNILNYGITRNDEKNVNVAISPAELGAGNLGMTLAVLAATENKKDLSATDSLSLQLKSVFQLSAEMAATKAPTFYANFFAKYFGELAKTDNMPAFARLMSFGAKKEETIAWFKEHPKELENLDKWVQLTNRSF